MKDLELLREFPVPLYWPPRRRCPSCGSLPRLLYRSVVSVGGTHDEYVDTCPSHYCRSRAPQLVGKVWTP